MTPHRHWLRDYTPHRVPVRLANNQIVHSAGLGSMLFVPEVESKGTGRPVLFSRVLHMPELGSNLLSVLYLVRHHQLASVGHFWQTRSLPFFLELVLDLSLCPIQLNMYVNAEIFLHCIICT